MLWDKNVALSGASYDVKECDLKNAPATASDKVVYPANWSNLADFITEGYNAVKSVFSDAIVIVHLDNGWDKELFNWFSMSWKTQREVGYDRHVALSLLDTDGEVGLYRR